MKRILKYPVAVGVSSGLPVRAPFGRIVHFGNDPAGQLCVWVVHDVDAPTRVDFEFVIAGTGRAYSSTWNAWGSTLDGTFVWHLLWRTAPKAGA